MSIGYWSIDYWMFSCILPVYQVVKDEPDEEDNCGLPGQMAPPVMNEDPLSEFRWRAHEGSCFVRCLFFYQGETIRCSAVNAWLSMFGPCWAVHVRLCMFCCPWCYHVGLWAVHLSFLIFSYYHTDIYYMIYWYTVYLFDLFDCPFDLFYVLYVCALQLSAVQN